MKYLVFFIILAIFGCQKIKDNPSSNIVGIWELSEIKLSPSAKGPQAPVTNKKGIYTKEGVYFDISASDNKNTETSMRKYKLVKDNLEIINENGSKRKAKFKFPDFNTLVLIDNENSHIIFKRLSKTTNPIPVIIEKYVKITDDMGRIIVDELQIKPK